MTQVKITSRRRRDAAAIHVRLRLETTSLRLTDRRALRFVASQFAIDVRIATQCLEAVRELIKLLPIDHLLLTAQQIKVIIEQAEGMQPAD